MGSWGMKANGISQVIQVIEQVKVDFEGDEVRLVGPTTEYAIFHEMGTSKMEARPFMRPAAQRVQANLGTYLDQVASRQGIPLTSEENIVQCAAIAVRDEAKKIADQKGVRDTGATIESIQIEEVS